MSIITFIEKVCVQTAVLWSYTGTDAFGQPVFAEPVEIKCRWEDKQQIVKESDGQEFDSIASILLTHDAKKGDYIYLGSLSELESDLNPKDVETAYEIQKFNRTPLIFSTTEFVRTAFL